MANDRRANPRHPIDAKARIYPLSMAPTLFQPIPARITDASPNGLRLLVPRPVAPGTPVRIDLDDAMLLGEICYCVPVPTHPTHAFHAGVTIEQCLSGLASLQHLIDALQPDPDREFESS